MSWLFILISVPGISSRQGRIIYIYTVCTYVQYIRIYGTVGLCIGTVYI